MLTTSRMPMSRLTAALLAWSMLLCGLLFAPAAFAQPQGTTLWIPLTDPDAEVPRATIEGIIDDILESANDGVHIVGRADIEEFVGRVGFPLPPCLQGVEVCTSPYQAVLQSLGANRVVTLVAYGGGETIDVTVGDGETEEETLRYESNDVRTTIFSIVSDLTGLTGTLVVQSDPPGAEVILAGEPMGTTPLEVNLPVGAYELTLEADGYYDYGSGVEVRANSTSVHQATMSRSFAAVTIRCGTPGATVHFDDAEEGLPVNVLHRLEPGTRTVEVRAPGYAPWRTFLELLPTDERDISVVLFLSEETIAARNEQRIRDWPLLLQGGIAFLGSSDDLSAAGGSAFGNDQDIACTTDASGTGCGDPVGIGLIGLRLDAIYNYGLFEIGLLGISMHGANLTGEDRAYRLEGTNELVTLTGGWELAIRALQPGVRYLIDDHFEPYARGGLGLAFERWSGEELPAGPDTSFSQTTLLLELQAGLRYHLNPLVYGFVQGEIGSGLGRGFRGGGTLGVGINIPDVFGIQRAIERRRARQAPATDTPAEL